MQISSSCWWITKVVVASYLRWIPAIFTRRRLIQLKLHGIYMLFLIKFWIQNTFKTYSSLFVGLSFQIFLIQITKNFCFTFRHSENSSLCLWQRKSKQLQEQNFNGKKSSQIYTWLFPWIINSKIQYWK